MASHVAEKKSHEKPVAEKKSHEKPVAEKSATWLILVFCAPRTKTLYTYICIIFMSGIKKKP